MSFWGRFTTPFDGGTLLAVGSAPTETGGVHGVIPQTVTLDGYTFPVNVKEWRSGPEDTFRDRLVASDQPTDSLFNAKGAWSRYRYSWHHGCGQLIGDFDPAADQFRFDTSYGIEWRTKYQMSLLKATVNRLSSASTGTVLCRSADYVFAGIGTALYRTTDLITWTAMTAPGGTILAMSTDGTDMYVATSTLMGRYLGAATNITLFTTAVTGNCTNVAFLSNRLLVGKDNALFECSSTGTLTTIKTHFQAAFRWTTLFNIGSRMYIGGYAGSRSELYTVTTDSSGALVQAQEAAPLPLGEKLRMGLSFAGACMIATSAGIRFAQVAGDGTLTYGALIDELGDCQAATIDGRYVFAGYSLMAGSRSGVLRAVVDEEISTLVPAYCLDLFEATTQNTVTGVVRLNGLTAFAVDGSGVWVQSATTYVGQGEVRSGRLLFGTVEPKALIGLDINFAPLLSGESIEVNVYNQNAVMIGAGTMGTYLATTLTVDLGGEQVPYVEVRVRLLGPGTSSPTVFSWRLRAYPVPPPVLQWMIPLIIGQVVTVNAGQGMDMSMNVDGVHSWIEDLYIHKRYTYLRIGTRSYRVRVDNFEWQPTKWTDSGDVPQGILVVQLVDA